MPVSASAGTTDDSQTRSVSQAPVGVTPVHAASLSFKRAQLADPVAVGNGGEHRFGVTGAEQLDLAARDHFGEQRHVGRMAFAQPVEQPAREMGGEAEVRVGVQRFDERLVAALVRVLDHFREIAHRLVGVDAEEQGDDWVMFLFVPPAGPVAVSLGVQLARRMVPPLSGDPPPTLIG